MASDQPLQVSALLEKLDAHDVEYVIIGGIAVGLHGHARATKDLDIMIEPSPANVERLWAFIEDVDAEPLERCGRQFSECGGLRIGRGCDPHPVFDLDEARALFGAPVDRHDAFETGAHSAPQAARCAGAGFAQCTHARSGQRGCDRFTFVGRYVAPVERNPDGLAGNPDARIVEAPRQSFVPSQPASRLRQ